MGAEEAMPAAVPETEPTAPERKKKRRWAKRIAIALGALLLLLVAAVALVNSPIGKRYVADQIAKVAPASGLRFEVGRIDGDLFRSATLHDVVVYDTKGAFLRIPEAEIDWRPLSWFTSGIDIRTAIARRATLERLPELLPGDPDAPTLPNFDIRIDRLAIENLTLAPGIIDDQRHRVDLTASADIRQGLADVEARGRLGREDRFAFDLEAEPDGDIFDLDLDYVAPRGGVIAGLIGAEAGYEARVRGGGSWSDWKGYLTVRRDAGLIGGFRLTNKAGLYGMVGQLDAAPLAEGLVETVAAPRISLALFTTLEESVLDGALRARSAALDVRAKGVVDLAANSIDGVTFAADLLDPDLFGRDVARLEGARLEGSLAGAFDALEIQHVLTAQRVEAGTAELVGLRQQGRARYAGGRWTLPLDLKVERIATGTAMIDPRLIDGSLGGQIVLAGDRITADALRFAFPGANGQLSLDGNLSTGRYALAGPVAVNGLPFDNLGVVNAAGTVDFVLPGGGGWQLAIDGRAAVPRISNATVADFVGPSMNLRGGVTLGDAGPIAFRNVVLDAQKLSLNANGQIAQGRTTLAGRGRHAEYGAFTIEGAYSADGPEAVLVLADPLPAAELRDVRLAISPSATGFAIDTSGGSLLGPFAGQLNLELPGDGPARLQIESLRVWETDITGRIAFEDAGARGNFALSGGGLSGDIAIAPQGEALRFDFDVDANNARFGGDTPIAIRRADITGQGILRDGSSTVDASVFAQGITYGALFVGRVAANAQLVDGRGTITGSIAGRRGSRFALQVNANVSPDRIAVAARGDFAGKALQLPRRAVLTRRADGGWNLARSQLNYDGGRTVVEGTFGGDELALQAWFASMPLSLIDVAAADQGLGGRLSGTIDYRAPQTGAPTGEVRVRIEDLTRSGLVLTSSPIDVGLVARLSPTRLEARAVFAEDGGQRGRAQARITGIPPGGALYDRLSAGDLFAQLRYDGAAQALWRLLRIETFDLGGPVKLSADVRGTLANPVVRGAVSSDGLRLQSALSGTDIRNVAVRGRFNGSRLRLTSFSGTAVNGGAVSGSGFIDLADIDATRGPRIDLRIATRNARLLAANGLDATVTGPLRIVSNGVGGTIAGRLQINRASWQLGIAADDVRLPQIATTEINAPADVAPGAAPTAPWRYLIDAQADSRVDVDGLGLDSEWEANIRLRGTTDDPRMGGAARVVRGSYSFAGTRFELVRGRIAFDENVPIDPRIDILAETDRAGIDVAVAVQGNATQPEISFTSTPSLPEEEILARLLFGGSVTDLSATDAVQLGAALASLRGGGGLDPINRLRTAIGLDRLRIVGSDPALGRSTGVALGKNIGRRFYVELITDGRGYSATEVEFRVTSWLSLLASVSTVGRESAVVEISRDY